VRRIQNRGYATLARIADYVDSLSAGDESNAVIEALDAVNLMTVHASKGLEFPIVFVVNLARGASGPPKPMRVAAAGPGGGASVSIGPFVSEVDEVERDREKHETRRLLYVALTRARDRLYLSSVLKDGAFAPGPGSLGEVLPESLRRLFAHAATIFDECSTVAWTGQSGHTFELMLCRPPATGTDARRESESPGNGGRPYVAAVGAGAPPSRGRVTAAGAPQDEREAIRGRLVHRLFQFAHLQQAEWDDAAVERFARGLMRPDERGSIPDADAVLIEALTIWRSLSAREDVKSLLATGNRTYEVPFSLHDPATASIVRGTIDCLLHQPDGRVVVLEFKTGGRQLEHEKQLATYVTAARALFPDSSVDGLLVYP
jgi:ATP-dependent helicase/nuclease subunit A